MPNDNSKAAFPQSLQQAHEYIGSEGMTLREYYAGQVVAQWAAVDGEQWRGKEMPHHVALRIAANAVTLADALLDALEK